MDKQGSEERKVKSEETTFGGRRESQFNSFISEITNKKQNNNEDIL